MKNYITFEAFKRRTLKDPEIKKEYDRLGPQFKLIALMIEKRAKEGLTQKKLAQKMGTKQSAISRFESGTYNPSLSFLYKLADALGAKLKISIS